MLKINLSGKVALVTGASGKLGRVMAAVLADAGADVAIHYHRNRELAESVSREIQRGGRRACIAQADLTQKSEVERLKIEVEKELGETDILVTNAVSQYEWKPVMEQDPAAYEDQFRSCVLQFVLAVQTFAPPMIRKNWGRVIAISTECVMQAQPTQSAYVSGKRGMDGVLRVLAREIGIHGITVNQVAPGWTISEEDRTRGTQKQEHYDRLVPLGRRGEDIEIAHAVAFLASDLASFITGVYLPVCGGNVMPAI